MPSTTTSAPVVLRIAGAADDAALTALAALDSSRLGPGPHLVAEVEERLVAAVSLADGAVVADPFAPTAGLVAVLRARAASERSADERRSVRARVRALRRRPRLAAPAV